MQQHQIQWYCGIVGQDFIRHHGLSFCAQSNSPDFVTPTRPKTAILAKSVYLPARSATMAPVQVENLGQQTLAINVPGCPQISSLQTLLVHNSIIREKFEYWSQFFMFQISKWVQYC